VRQPLSLPVPAAHNPRSACLQRLLNKDKPTKPGLEGQNTGYTGWINAGRPQKPLRLLSTLAERTRPHQRHYPQHTTPHGGPLPSVVAAAGSLGAKPWAKPEQHLSCSTRTKQGPHTAQGKLAAAATRPEQRAQIIHQRHISQPGAADVPRPLLLYASQHKLSASHTTQPTAHGSSAQQTSTASVLTGASSA
jgi:hypothetical protein